MLNLSIVIVRMEFIASNLEVTQCSVIVESKQQLYRRIKTFLGKDHGLIEYLYLQKLNKTLLAL